jgi:hypothetical protein
MAPPLFICSVRILRDIKLNTHTMANCMGIGEGESYYSCSGKEENAKSVDGILMMQL